MVSLVMNQPAARVIARPPVGSIQLETKWSAVENQPTLPSKISMVESHGVEPNERAASTVKTNTEAPHISVALWRSSPCSSMA